MNKKKVNFYNLFFIFLLLQLNQAAKGVVGTQYQSQYPQQPTYNTGNKYSGMYIDMYIYFTIRRFYFLNF